MDKLVYIDTLAADEEIAPEVTKIEPLFGQVIYLHPALFEEADRESPEPEAA